MSSDKLVFYNRSADKLPGKGIHEYVTDPSVYGDLTIPNWRRILCSQWDEQTFWYDKYTFRSIDHAFQYAKFAVLGYLEVAYRFTVESGDPISGLQAYRYRKLMILSAEELSQWELVRRTVKYDITYCKFSQIEVARFVLLATREAEIWNSGPRIKSIRCTTLEQVRNTLKSQ